MNKEYRCTSCNKLLFKYYFVGRLDLSIKCNKCGEINNINSKTESMDEKFLTVQEYAELIKQHPQTVYERIRLGEIVGYKFGKSVRIPVTQKVSAEDQKLKEENKILKEKIKKYEDLAREITIKLITMGKD